MSWLVTSIANSLQLGDDEDYGDNDIDSASAFLTNTGDNQSAPAAQSQPRSPQIDSSMDSDGATTPRRGVKDDLSEFSKTLSRQFWGVASFLAPPLSPTPQISDRDPGSHPISDRNDESGLDSSGIAGIRTDLSKIGGRFRTGIAKLSSNKAVCELTKMATNFLQQLGEEIEESVEDYARQGVVGVTEEVVAFARDISLHPETWLDFPLPDDDEEGEDFIMSDIQQDHALAVERLSPSLAALRIDLCPGYMNEGSFWKIYFVLVHPRLSKDDALLLSTPQVMEARAMLTQELHKRNKSRAGISSLVNASVDSTTSQHEESFSVLPSGRAETVPAELSSSDSAVSAVPFIVEMDKHPLISAEIPIVDKEVVDESPINMSSNEPSTSTSIKGVDQKYKDDGDAWLKEDYPQIVGVSSTVVPIENDEDVSFSDLEDDDDDVPSSYSRVAKADPCEKDSQQWVGLKNKSAASKGISTIRIDHAEPINDHQDEDKEIGGWLDFDDIDSS